MNKIETFKMQIYCKILIILMDSMISRTTNKKVFGRVHKNLKLLKHNKAQKNHVSDKYYAQPKISAATAHQ